MASAVVADEAPFAQCCSVVLRRTLDTAARQEAPTVKQEKLEIDRCWGVGAPLAGRLGTGTQQACSGFGNAKTTFRCRGVSEKWWYMPWLVVVDIEGWTVEQADSVHAAARCSMIPYTPGTVPTKQEPSSK